MRRKNHIRYRFYSNETTTESFLGNLSPSTSTEGLVVSWIWLRGITQSGDIWACSAVERLLSSSFFSWSFLVSCSSSSPTCCTVIPNRSRKAAVAQSFSLIWTWRSLIYWFISLNLNSDSTDCCSFLSGCSRMLVFSNSSCCNWSRAFVTCWRSHAGFRYGDLFSLASWPFPTLSPLVVLEIVKSALLLLAVFGINSLLV